MLSVFQRDGFALRGRCLLVGATLGAALAAAPRADAQQITSPYRFVETSHSLSGFGGFMVTQRGTAGHGPHSGPLAGVRYTYRVAPPLSLEAGVAGVPTNRTVLAAGADGPIEVEDAPMAVMMAEGGLRLHLTGNRTWNAIAPFLVVTGGVAGNVRGRPAVEADIPAAQRVPFGPGFAVGVGGGTDWFLTETLSLRLEAKDYLWRLTLPEGLAATPGRETQWTHNGAFSIGVAKHF